MEVLARGQKDKAGECAPTMELGSGPQLPSPALMSTFAGLPEWEWHPYQMSDVPAPLHARDGGTSRPHCSGQEANPSLDGQERRSLGGKFLPREVNAQGAGPGWAQARRHKLGL